MGFLDLLDNSVLSTILLAGRTQIANELRIVVMGDNIKYMSS